MTDTANYIPAYYKRYTETIRKSLMEELGLKNIHEVPKLEKIVLNMGVGDGARDEKVIIAAEQDLAMIAGQKPRRNRSRIAVASFKLRQGMPVGASVTLRGYRMYEFLERMISVAMPRIRDFRGLNPNGFDGRGNYNFGVKEHTIFREVDHGDQTNVFGMNVTLVTSARDDEGALKLLRHFQFPIRENTSN